MRYILTVIFGVPLLVIFFIFIFILALLKFEVGRPHLKDIEND